MQDPEDSGTWAHPFLVEVEAEARRAVGEAARRNSETRTFGRWTCFGEANVVVLGGKMAVYVVRGTRNARWWVWAPEFVRGCWLLILRAGGGGCGVRLRSLPICPLYSTISFQSCGLRVSPWEVSYRQLWPSGSRVGLAPRDLRVGAGSARAHRRREV